MFLFFGTRPKSKGIVSANIYFNGSNRNAEIEVIQNFIHLFWIPIIPISKSYQVYFPDTGEMYASGTFGNMPPELKEECARVTATR